MTKEEIRKLEQIARLKRERIAKEIARLQMRWRKSNYKNYGGSMIFWEVVGAVVCGIFAAEAITALGTVVGMAIVHLWEKRL